MLLHIILFGLPIVLAVTLHEAAHGYVALYCGDNTAKRAGRVSLNPLRHIDPIGTILLPGILLATGAPALFGYAKPVPVNFEGLNHPRRDSILVAAAGPGMNFLLAFLSALLFHAIPFLPEGWTYFLNQMLSMSVLINVTLAVFNMLPLPPLDGGRVAVGLLPNALAYPLARVEPYGMYILFGLLLIPPFFGINLFSAVLMTPIQTLCNLILMAAGLG